MVRTGHFAKENVHPRVHFTRRDVESFRRRAQEDAGLQKEVEKWLERADSLLDKPFLDEAYADSVYSQHGRYYEVSALLEELSSCLGFAYLLTGEAKYARKLRDAMLYYAKFKCWTGPMNKDRDTPWHSDLATTRIAVAITLAYDCVYDALTREERKTVANAVLRLGVEPLLADWVLPETRVHALDSMGHNWWAVCIGLAGVALLGVYEYAPKAEEWLDLTVEALHAFCTYPGGVLLNKVPNFDKQGLFYESANYFDYGVGELMHFAYSYRLAMENGERDVAFPGMEKACDAFLAMSYPTSDENVPLQFPDFGDAHLDSRHIQVPRYMALCGYGGKSMVNAYQLGRGGDRDAMDYLLADVLWGETAPIHLPKDTVFPESGYAYLRSSWEKDATLLAVRCGYTWNHAHDDAGHFMLFDKGLPIISDSGCCSYDRPEYKDYFCMAAAHNVVTVNGRSILPECNYRGGKFPGSFPHFLAEGDYKYLLADATGPTSDQCARNYRNFLLLGGDILVIVDDLLAHQEAQFESLLHYRGEGRFEEGGVTFTNGRSVAKARFLFPENMVLEQRTGYLDPDPGQLADPINDPLTTQPYMAAVAPEKTRVQQFVTVVGLNGAADMQCHPFTGKNMLGARIVNGDVTWEVAYNLLADGRKMHENSNNTLLGLDTDSYILVRKSVGGRPESHLMVYGSYLRGAGKKLYAGFQKTFAVLKA